MDNDLNRSAERIADSEETRVRRTGFGTTKPGRALPSFSSDTITA
jgi:hypothetical protein